MVKVDGKTEIKGVCKKTAASGWSSQWVADHITWGSEKKVSGVTSGYPSLIFQKDAKFEGSVSVWAGSIGRPQPWTYSKDRVASTPEGLVPKSVGFYQLQRSTFIDAADLDTTTAGEGDKSCGADGLSACPTCMKDISAVTAMQAHVSVSGPNFQDCSLATDGAKFAEVKDVKGVTYTDATAKQKWTTLVAPGAGTRVGLNGNTGVYVKLTYSDLTAWSGAMCSATTTKACISSDVTDANKYATTCDFSNDGVSVSKQEWPETLASCSATLHPEQEIYVPIARIHAKAGLDKETEIKIAIAEGAGVLISGALGRNLMIAGIAAVVIALVCCVCSCKS